MYKNVCVYGRQPEQDVKKKLFQRTSKSIFQYFN